MNWHYAVGGQQQGPVDDAQLDALIQAGTVTPETLVWREGMPNWQPLRQARPSSPGIAGAPAAPPVAAPPVAGGTSGPGEVVCAECGKLFTKDNAIQYGTTWVCATCKPVFLQKLREGASPGAPPIGQPGAPFDPDAFLAAIRERDYTVDIGSCIGRGWELVKSNFWISVGVVVVVYVCLIASGIIPCLNWILQLVVPGPLMGGMYLFFLKLIRRQEASVGDAFSGFSIAFLQLFLVGLVTNILIILCMIPAGVIIGIGAAATKSDPSPLLIGLAVLVGIIPVVYLSICWLFSIPLVIDKRIDFWPAMELSRKIVTMHWGSIFLLALVGGLLILAGFLVCLGALVTAPVVVAAFMYAYEDIFSGGSPTQS